MNSISDREIRILCLDKWLDPNVLLKSEVDVNLL